MKEVQWWVTFLVGLFCQGALGLLVYMKDCKLSLALLPSYIQSCKQSSYQTFCNWCSDLTGLLLSLSGAAQRVFLSSNNLTPCYNNTVDLICYYPDVMEEVGGQFKYTATTASWREDGQRIFPDEDVFDLQNVNQTASRLRVRIDPANFTGDPVSFTCYLPLTSGGEDSASRVVDPQGIQYTHLFI